MKRSIIFLFAIVLLAGLSHESSAQRSKSKDAPKEAADQYKESDFSGFKLRSIGPALMSGRIADLVIHPDKEHTWYVAVGSGGVWKTENAGTTWKSIFDGQASYSIGCITLDPQDPEVVWVGTGENVGGRHVGYGDGIYKSEDGGQTWKNMGLKASEHISKIIIHPENPDILWVAAQGPLWSPGGERGLYKTTNGGETWTRQLGDDEFTGATDILIDPRDPDVLYVATWQHHRTVAAYMGGGEKTALYKTKDGGEKWNKLSTGLPKGNLGKIGLAMSPQNPNVVYAAIELDRRTGGLYRSDNRGASWKKMSSAVSGGTGPHYYQELYASPAAFDRLYLVDASMQVSTDGGKTFTRMNDQSMHGDYHAMAFKEGDPNYILMGTDGGVYESFDLEKTWRFMANLPLTQFYKVAVDDKEPFYTVYGGTQDNNTQAGPSRTDNTSGIRNADWEIVLFADGHQPATEPGNPDIMYAEWQEGNLVRVDRRTGEIVYIQPQPEKGEPAERFNWDSPILVSPHKPTTIFHASHRVWKSENRGDSWTAISPDLTKNQERITMPIMGKKQSWDSPWDMYAMSTYNTITSLAQSPVNKDLIYAGTDDGLIQVTPDGGTNWGKIEVSALPGVPETAFVNDIKADLFDENTVYVCLDNHKYGDYKPYLLKSTDRGNTWSSIASNLPERQMVWRIVQDHVKPKLMFVAAEFGIYFTVDAGREWVKLTGGAPTISFRDLAIQRRENDLVGASFGRGFYILDDYSPLREVSSEKLAEEASLFPVKDALWYIPRNIFGRGAKGSQGDAYYLTENPPFGAVMTYYLKEDIKTMQQERKENEKKLKEENKDIPFPGYEAIDAENVQVKPMLWLTISDSKGNVVRKVKAPAKKGFNRVAWDLRYASMGAVTGVPSMGGPGGRREGGILVVPGTYSVSLSKEVDGLVSALDGPVSFEVKPLRKGSLEGKPYEETVAFAEEAQEFMAELSVEDKKLEDAKKLVDLMRVSLDRSSLDSGELEKELHEVKMRIIALERKVDGSAARQEIGEKNPHTISQRMQMAMMASFQSTYGPTPAAERSFEIAKEEFGELKTEFLEILEKDVPALQKKLEEAGAPPIAK